MTTQMYYCPACGLTEHQCRGHLLADDPSGFYRLVGHKDGNHTRCEPLGCDQVEGVVCQVKVDGKWVDYSRGTLGQVQRHVGQNRPGMFRGVHWINGKVLVEERAS